MLKKICLLCLTAVLIFTACNGDEPAEDPPSGPEVHSVDCSVQNLIGLLEDIPPNGLVINLSDCIYTFDTINNVPNDPEDDTFGGVALPVIDGTVTINGTGNATFSRSTAGGIEPFRFLFVAPSGILTVRDIRFTNGHINLEMTDLDRKGGAIFNYGGALTVENCDFENNQAHHGGAIASESGGTEISDSWFVHNHSFMQGGAVAIIGHGFEYSEIRGSDFTENSSEAAGGALYSEGRLRLGYVSTFERNESLRSGGALAISGGVAFVTDTDFDQNIADLGGAVAAYICTMSVRRSFSPAR